MIRAHFVKIVKLGQNKRNRSMYWEHLDWLQLLDMAVLKKGMR